MPKQVRYQIYDSVVKTGHIDCLIEIWGTSAQTNLNIIQIESFKLCLLYTDRLAIK